ncbi:branched-chain amino acid ABC transporter permease [Haloplanus litoreus]|uniref:Branched-chain amino acid ABC transporter permease n=1 Tax=Haloplanus litoreus TaxID=767515 RepID=A0ABD5ZYA7_9EURY
MVLSTILEILVFGFIFGSLLALAGVGLSLIYSIADFPNFAHGDYMMFGGYMAFLVNVQLGLPMAVAFVVGVVSLVAVALVVDRLAFKPLRNAGPVPLLIASIGVALFIRNLIKFVWGTSTRNYAGEWQRAQEILPGVEMTGQQITLVVVAVSMMLAVHLLLSRTKLGKSMRAMSDNRRLARASGIYAERTLLWTWVIGAALAAAAGILLGMNSSLAPYRGFIILLAIFAAVILGGIGSPYGAMAGGLIIGIAYEATPYIPGLDGGYKFVTTFAIMIVVLLVKPQGIFGGEPG